jgi:homoserine kinase type II
LFSTDTSPVSDADLRAWAITPTSRERAEHGLNNDSFFISAREGEFVLRVYRNTADPQRVRDEHDLLARLAMQELPFAVPVPLRTTDGDTLAVLESDAGPRLAALFDRIPGDPASLDVPNARLAGRALGQLDGAFGRLDLPVRAPAALRDVHPLVPDPHGALGELAAEVRGAFDAPVGAAEPALGRSIAGFDHAHAIFDRVDAAREAIAASLPRQIVHGDFAFPNLLVEGGTVTGMLDFEFAGADVRAADLACAMYVTVVRGDPAKRWQLLEALAAGYRRALPLDPLEVAAVPDLMLRRSAIGIVHWLGRWQQGIAPRAEPEARVERGIRFVEWLDANAPRVAATVAGGFKPPR